MLGNPKYSNMLFCVRDGVVSCDLESGRALLDLNSGTYFRLNESADHIWQTLENGPATAEALSQIISDAFEVSHSDCIEDVLGLLEALHERGLIESDAS